jgi:hypothetical protein
MAGRSMWPLPYYKRWRFVQWIITDERLWKK